MKKLNIFVTIFFNSVSFLRDRINKLPRASFGRGIIVLVGGTALGQGIQLFAAPFLTRLYGPEDFGLLAVYMAILGILSVVASLRYEIAIPLPADDNVASCLLVVSLVIVFMMSIIISVAAWLYGDTLLILINAPRLKPFLWLVPVGVFGAGSYKVLNYWAVRKKAFGCIASTKIGQGLGTVFLQILFGIISVTSGGLLLGHMAGQFIGVGTLSSKVVQDSRNKLVNVTCRGLFQAIVQYRRFPIYSSCSAVLNTLSVQAPVLILSFFWGPMITGFFSLSLRVLQTPIALIGQAVSQVFVSRAAESDRDGQLAGLTLMVFCRLVQVGLPLVLLVGLSAPELFSFVFGSEWRDSGIYAQWLSPWLFFVFVSSPLSILPSIKGKQRQEMIFNGSLLFSRLVVLLVCGVLDVTSIAVALFGMVSTVFWFGFTLWNMALSGNTWKPILCMLTKEMFHVTPFFLLVVLAKIFFPSPSQEFLVVIATILSGLLIVVRLYLINFFRDVSL